jgi:hypothetical protein
MLSFDVSLPDNLDYVIGSIITKLTSWQAGMLFAKATLSSDVLHKGCFDA